MPDTFTAGQVPTVSQWNTAFNNKQSALGFTPLNSAGGVMTGLLATVASTTATSGFNIPPGVAPTTPNNGDMWATAANLFVELNGTTYQLTGGSTGAVLLTGNNTISGSNVFTGSVTFLGTVAGTAFPIVPTIPQGRITLQSGSAVMAGSQLNGTTIYYAPYNGNQIPIYNGTATLNYSFVTGSGITGLSINLSGGSASWPANTLFDVFATLNGTAATLCTGPAWVSSIARSGSGAIGYYNGYLVNTSSIAMTGRTGSASTLTIPQYQATYLGTVATNNGTAAQVSFVYGFAASGGGQAILNVWNYYNRVLTTASVIDNSGPYTNASSALANNSARNRVTFIEGVAEDYANVAYLASGSGGSLNSVSSLGIGLDTITPFTVFSSILGVSNAKSTVTTPYQMPPQIGAHFIQALESATASVINGFNGTGSPGGGPFNTLEFAMRM